MYRSHVRTRFAGIAVLAAVVGSCSGEPTGTVRAAVAALTISPATAEIGVGGTVPLQATVKDAGDNVLADRRVVWNSSDADVGTVSAGGVVTARRVGTAQMAAGWEANSAIAVISGLPTP